MRVRVSDPAFVYDLLCSLKQAGYAAAQASADTVEVRIPSAVLSDEAKLHLGHYLANWRARHPGVVAEMIESRRAARSSNDRDSRPFV